MPSFNDTYGSPALKPEDVKTWGGAIKVTINDVELTTFQDRDSGKERKQFVLQLAEIPDKQFYLNKTNGTQIADAYGDNTDFWMNKVIYIFCRKGQTEQGIQDRLFVEIPPEFRPQPQTPGIPQQPGAQLGHQAPPPAVSHQPAPVATQQAPQPAAPAMAPPVGNPPASAYEQDANAAARPPSPPPATLSGQQGGTTIQDDGGFDDDIPFDSGPSQIPE